MLLIILINAILVTVAYYFEMARLTPTLICVKAIQLICALCLSAVSACSDKAQGDGRVNSVLPGWYKLEGTHKVTVVRNGQPEEIFDEKKLDSFFCMSAEEAKRKSKDEIVATLKENGFEVLEVSVEPLKDTIKSIAPKDSNVQNVVGITISEYRPDRKGITSSIEGSGELADGSFAMMTKTKMTWISGECQNLDGETES